MNRQQTSVIRSASADVFVEAALIMTAISKLFRLCFKDFGAGKSALTLNALKGSRIAPGLQHLSMHRGNLKPHPHAHDQSSNITFRAHSVFQ